MPFDHRALAAALGITWTGPFDADENEDFVVVRGEVERHPAMSSIEERLRAVGFSSVPSRRTTTAFGTQHFAKRGTERLEISLLLPSVFRGVLRHGPRVTIQWLDRARRPLEGQSFEWRGRAWPFFFDEPSLHHRSRDLLILEGKVPPEGAAACFTRFREWARGAGLAEGLPAGSLGAIEPDLATALAFHDAELEVTLDPRGGRVLLQVAPRPAAER